LRVFSVGPLGQPPMVDVVHDQNGNDEERNQADEGENHGKESFRLGRGQAESTS
jgi:hypothetical protein